MKHLIHFFKALLLLILVVGCSETDNLHLPEQPQVPVSFNAGMIATRMVDNVWEEDDALGIFMLDGGEELAHENILFTARNLKYTVTDTETGALTNTERVLYYPQTGTADFIAYYPYLPDNSADYDADNYTIAVERMDDYLYSKVEGKSSIDPNVRFACKHTAVKITLNVKYGFGFTADDVSVLDASDVTFKGMPTKGTLNLNEGIITPLNNSVSNFNPTKLATPTSGYQVTFTTQLIPNRSTDYSDRAIDFALSGMTGKQDRVVTWQIPDTEVYTGGLHYTYNITINNTDLIIEPTTITPWLTAPGTTDVAEYTHPLGLELVYIPAGEFTMKFRDSDKSCTVKLTRDFYMTKYEITNEQYVAFLNDIKEDVGYGPYLRDISDDNQTTFREINHIYYKNSKDHAKNYTNKNIEYPILYRWTSVAGDKATHISYDYKVTKTFSIDSDYKKHPAAYIGWFGAYEYALWAGGQLPTIAQWQYACRAGTTGKYYDSGMKNDYDTMRQYANCSSDGLGHDGSGVTSLAPIAVGYYEKKRPGYLNPWGLCDMYGNMMEWCIDRSLPEFNDGDTLIDPIGTGGGDKYRIMGGSSWWSSYKNTNSEAYSVREIDTAIEVVKRSGYDYYIGNENGGAFSHICGFRIIYVP